MSHLPSATRVLCIMITFSSVLSFKTAGAQCPQNLLWVQARGNGNQIMTSEAVRSLGVGSGNSGAVGSYDLPMGILKMLAGGDAEAQVLTHDTFVISGPPMGTPVTFLARLKVYGAIIAPQEVFTRFARVEVSIREGASNSQGYGRTVFSGAPPYSELIDTTLVITIQALAGNPVDIFLSLIGGATHGGESRFNGTNDGARISFAGLEPGMTITSCQGFVFEEPVAVTPASWSAIKTRFLNNDAWQDP